MSISLSSDVSPEMREYERFSTTCANAYVQPIMGGYLRRLETELRQLGVKCPLFLMQSGGGLTTIDTAIRFPVRLVESGPAGGAIFSGHLARQMGITDVLSFDMGGTTAKICVIDDFTAQTARGFEVARIYRFKKGSGLPCASRSSRWSRSAPGAARSPRSTRSAASRSARKARRPSPARPATAWAARSRP